MRNRPANLIEVPDQHTDHGMTDYNAIVRSGTGPLDEPTTKSDVKAEPQNPAEYDPYVVLGNSANLIYLYIKGTRLTRQELQTIASTIDRQGGEYRRRD